MVVEYSLYLCRERGLAARTASQYSWFVRRFLADRFGDASVQLTFLLPEDFVGFVQREAARLKQPKRSQLMTSALRSFLHYARYRAYIKTDLSGAVPGVASWTMTSIPKAIPVEHARGALACCNRRSAVGRRDYAILLLLARLGLRANEVASLRLEDIDWENGHLLIQGKGGRECQLPLPVDVGKAIAAYLHKGGRPRCDSRNVFLYVHAPIGGLNSSTVSKVVRRALARAGIDSQRKGAHQFRHALASEMLRRGSSLLEIGEVLRHASPDTTRIYAKVDLSSLRELAQPWPEARS
jgi:site-specific recombinase XerD